MILSWRRFCADASTVSALHGVARQPPKRPIRSTAPQVPRHCQGSNLKPQTALSSSWRQRQHPRHVYTELTGTSTRSNLFAKRPDKSLLRQPPRVAPTRPCMKTEARL